MDVFVIDMNSGKLQAKAAVDTFAIDENLNENAGDIWASASIIGDNDISLVVNRTNNYIYVYHMELSEAQNSEIKVTKYEDVKNSNSKLELCLERLFDVYYDAAGNVYVCYSELDVNQTNEHYVERVKYGSNNCNGIVVLKMNETGITYKGYIKSDLYKSYSYKSYSYDIEEIKLSEKSK